MQATKDSFYITLRDRLVAVDPGRTITHRRGHAAGDRGGGERTAGAITSIV